MADMDKKLDTRPFPDREVVMGDAVIFENHQPVQASSNYGVGVNTVENGFVRGGLWIPGEKRPFYRVIDVGCGPGLYTKAIAHALGANGYVLGLDPDPMIQRVAGDDTIQGRGPSYCLTQGTVTEEQHRYNDFDLALCIEVAEHIPVMDIRDFVRQLCSLAPILIFSAAAPGQGGDGHINCRDKSWWRELFGQFGFKEDPEKTSALCSFMAGGYHLGWLTQNVMVLTSYGYRNFTSIDAEEAPQAERLASFIRDTLPGWLEAR